MRLLAQIGRREVWLRELQRPYAFSEPFGGALFVCVLFACDPALKREEQNALSTQIVLGGCRYALATGIECSSWDDAIDWAHLETDPNFDPPDSEMVMTTWHDGCPVAEVLDFAWRHTNFDDHDFTRFLMLVIGNDPGLVSEIEREVARLPPR